MTNKQIEEAGIAAINTYFSRCEHISANLSQNDKTPLWDGELFLYNHSTHSIANLIGPVKIQVKSHNKIAKRKVKQTIPVINLKSYKENGGILYFSVFVGDENSPKIFYKALTQVLIKKYIRSANGNNAVKIEFEELPEDRTKVEDMILDFYEQCHLQTPIANTDVISIKDYFLPNGNKTFYVTTRCFNPIKNFPEYLRNHQLYLYETDNRGRITNVIGDGPVTLLVGSNKVRTITAGQYQLKVSCTAFLNENKLTINLDEYLILECDLNTGSGIITYNESRHLSRQKLEEFQVILAINETQSLSIDTFSFNLSGKRMPTECRQEFENKIKILKQFHELLDSLHIKKDIRFEDLTKEQIQTVVALYNAIVEKKTLSLAKPIKQILRLALGKIKILLVSKKEANGKYKIQDFFDPAIEYFSIKDKTANTGYYVNRISTLSPKDFEELDNIFFENIVPEYKKIASMDKAIMLMANNDMLKLINAYDAMREKKPELLAVAEQIVNWLSESECDVDSNINKINKYQIQKRKRELTAEEKEELYAISESSKDESVKVGALVLSENLSAAKSHLARLTKKDQEFLKTLPIYYFLK